MKKKNILFAVLFVIIILLIMLFNFFTDPYIIFHPNPDKKQSNFEKPIKLIYTNIRAYKDSFKPEILIFGGSDAKFLFGAYNQYKQNNIGVFTLTYMELDERYKLLKYYLELHPEVKKIFIILAYNINFPDVIMVNPDILPQGNFWNGYSLSELSYLLLSAQTTGDSLNITKQNIKNKINRTKYTEDFYRVLPRNFSSDKANMDDKELKKRIENIYSENKQTIEKMIELLKEKDIEYSIIIPPYHALHMTYFYNNEIYLQNIKDFKKFLVDIAPEVYDFQFINKYTTCDLYRNNYLFPDLAHISPVFGIKILKYFFDKKNREEDICLILTKDNIEQMLDLEYNLLKDYENTNKKLVDEYIGYYTNPQPKNIAYTLYFQGKDMPDNFKKELEYIPSSALQKD